MYVVFHAYRSLTPPPPIPLTVLCRDDAIGVTDPRRLLAAALLGLVHRVREVRHPPLSRGLHPNEHA